MAATLPTPPTREPQIIFAGNFVQWNRSATGHGPDGTTSYPASEWTLTYWLRGPQVYTFSAATDPNGTDFLVTLEAATTATWQAGYYSVAAFVTAQDGSGDRFTLKPYFSVMEIKANPAVNPQGNDDPRPWAVQMLAVVEQAIADLVSRKAAQTSINGQSYSIQDVEKLYRMRGRFQEEVRRIESQERLNAGLGAKKNILVRFRKPAAQAFPQFPWPP